jgi:hypothetical protein
VVRFVGHGDAPPSRSLIEDLSRLAGIPLGYQRPLSGGYHLLAVPSPVASADLEQALGRLARHPEVEDVALDPVVHAQSKR